MIRVLVLLLLTEEITTFKWGNDCIKKSPAAEIKTFALLNRLEKTFSK